MRAGDEILVNYRLSPAARSGKPWPSWYQPVDTAEDERRWSQPGILATLAKVIPK